MRLGFGHYRSYRNIWNNFLWPLVIINTNEDCAIQFMDYVIDKFPFWISTFRTDRGHEFQAGFHWHVEDQGMQHVYIKPRTPLLYAIENDGNQAVVSVKYFTPNPNWTWYSTEFDGRDLFFGLVDGPEAELGYFSLRELQEVRGALGLPIERDLDFGPQTLAQVRENLSR